MVLWDSCLCWSPSTQLLGLYLGPKSVRNSLTSSSHIFDFWVPIHFWHLGISHFWFQAQLCVELFVVVVVTYYLHVWGWEGGLPGTTPSVAYWSEVTPKQRVFWKHKYGHFILLAWHSRHYESRKLASLVSFSTAFFSSPHPDKSQMTTLSFLLYLGCVLMGVKLTYPLVCILLSSYWQ